MHTASLHMSPMEEKLRSRQDNFYPTALQNVQSKLESQHPIPIPLVDRTSSSIRARAMGVFLVVLLLCVSRFGFCSSGSSHSGVENLKIHPVTPPLGIPENIQHSWGSYSPWFAAGDMTPLPDGCEVVQANILQRHGARYPTKNGHRQIKAVLSKLKSVKSYTDPSFKFLKHFKFDLGRDDLVPFGAAQSFDAGQAHYERYKHLVSEDNLPFVRATGSDRVIMSATNWTAGFTYASKNKYEPKLALVFSQKLNNSLDNAMCPNAGTSDAEVGLWESVYTPTIAARLNAGAPGANLSAADIGNLISLCPFETVAKEKPSEFCGLFTQDEFDGYEYQGDVDKYYGTGYGQPLGRIQGVGYVNELLARLTVQPVQDHTQTNTTLDSSPTTFPLNRTIYADFSHDNQMAAIYATLGLFANQPDGIDPTKPDPARTWVSSKLVPFSARMIAEKISCGAGAEEGGGKEYVRIMVNDGVQPLEFCGGSEENGGLCEIGAFVESQGYARSGGEGDWEKCSA